MIKPESNAPASMQPWVDATDLQLANIEEAVNRLESGPTAATGASSDTVAGVNSSLSFSLAQDDSASVEISNATLSGKAYANDSLQVNGPLYIGAPGETSVESGVDPDGLPAYVIQEVPRVKIDPSFYTTEAQVNGLVAKINGLNASITSDGFVLDVSMDSVYLNQGLQINSITGDGTTATLRSPDTMYWVLERYTAGVAIALSGTPDYDTNAVIILSATVDGGTSELVLTFESTATATNTTGYFILAENFGSLPQEEQARISMTRPAPNYGYSYMVPAGFGVGTASDAITTTINMDTGIATVGASISETLRLTSEEDVSPTSTLHPFQVGLTSGANIRMDNNEIIAVNNGAIAPLYINSEGSTVNIGNTGSTALEVTGAINSAASVATNSKSGVILTQTSGCHLSSTGYGLFARTGGIPGYFHRYGASGTVSFVQFVYNGANNGTINIASGGTPAFASGSDYRIKENIRPVTDAIERMKKAKAYTFNKIDSIDPSDNLHTGFIAHELAEVQPDAVIGEKDAVDAYGNPEYQQVMEAKIIPVMAQAINDLIAMNEKLEARLAALEAR